MKILASKNEITTNSQLRDILHDYLLDNDIYHGDVEKAMDDIMYEYDGIFRFEIDRYGDIVNVYGELENDESIDLRVTLLNGEKLLKVEDFQD